MRLRLVVCVVVLSAAGCLCSGPPTGECTGTWGGATYEKALVDMASKVVIVRATTCGAASLKRYEISWKERSLVMSATLFNGPSILAKTTDVLPPDAGSRFVTFSITPDPPVPTGTIELGITGIQGRRTGTLSLSSATESLTCTFEVPYESEGQRLSCGGSGDSD